MERVESNELLGVGLYSLPEAARIIGTTPRTLRQWAKTYRYTSRGVTYTHQPLIYRHLDDEGVLTFLELIELYFVHLFRSAGVPMPVIRKAAQAAARRFDTLYPFAVKRFDTDGKSIFATLSDQPGGHLLTEDLAKGQYAFTAMVRPYFRKLDYRGDAEALRFWPRDHDGRVVLDPTRQFGAPIDAETGVQTRALYDAVTAGQGQSYEDIACWFAVPVAAVEAAVIYERSLVAA